MIIRYKYPRTPHIPWSLGKSNDDKTLDNLDHFISKEIIITEKMDGQNTTLYPDYFSHARSLDSDNHPSRDWVKAFHSTIAHKMGFGVRICGENVYAKHSIEYKELESYFYAFSVWSDEGWCFSWDNTKEYLKELGVEIVPELWRGMFDKKVLRTLSTELDTIKSEGFVIRVADGFSYKDFDKNVAKYVRASHVTSENHWMHQQIVPNQLK